MKKIKFIKRQDSGFKLSYGNSGETSLNLSNEIFDFISQGSLSPGEERNVTFRIFKEDCIKAMSFVIMKLPLYKSSSNYSNKVDNYLDTFGELYSKIESFFGVNKDAEYKVSLFYRTDGRIYLKGLRVNGFSVRDYLVENYSALQFDDEGDGMLNLRILSDIEDNGEFEDEEALEFEDVISIPLQQIFYGAPGTGKSHKIKDDVDVKAADEKNLVFRTTFHPDSDYSTFVGAYKPTIAKKAVRNVAGDIVQKDKEEVYEDCISYSFVPQAFLQAYVAAWNNLDEKVFLIIEEINRGNCAQIFGDLFQLLDRDEDGWSEYPIMADRDLAKYLNGKDEDGLLVLTNKDGIKDGKLCLPKNLHIWATMNTSDQSLFPIDSAFKRRWDWVYMPIADAKKNYVIEIDNDQYDWWSFLTAINTIIESTTHSEDKKLGYFFAKAKDCKITANTFVGKVIFYLWNDVFKDNESNHKAFKDSNGEMLAFHRFFHDDGSVNTNVVIKFLQDLEVYPFEVLDDGTSAPSTTVPNAKRQRDNSRYSVNGKDGLNKAQMTREAFRLYIDAHPEDDAQAIAQSWNGLGLRDYVRHLVETEDEFNTRTTCADCWRSISEPADSPKRSLKC